MTSMTDARRRVDEASGLAEVLDAAYDAFEDMLTAIYGYHDAGGPFYPALIMAAADAANGRDAVAFAASLPPSRQVQPAATTAADPVAWQDLGASIAALSSSLSARLREVAAAAKTAEDRRACLDAARYADEVHGLAAASLQ